MPRMLILADDLSGAADCGVACIIAGVTTVVALGEVTDNVRPEVLSIDADTRRLSAIEAADEVRRLVQRYASDPKLLLFKKIDSTLRGHVGVEVAATLEAYRSIHSGGAVALMAPAFPAVMRTTVDGYQLLHGRLLHETEIWRAHAMQGRSYIPEMLLQAGLSSALIKLEVIRSSGGALVEAMMFATQGADVLVCDAETDADLRSIADASMMLGRKTVWVGSAGLSQHLLLAAGMGSSNATVECKLPTVEGPLLFVIGSMSSNSREQVQVLTSSSEIAAMIIPPAVLLQGQDSPQWHMYEQELRRMITAGRDVVLSPGSEVRVAPMERLLLSAALAEMTIAVSDRVGALVAAGGETARRVLQCWGVTGLRLVSEVERGVPASVTEGWRRELVVITKAGDFGGPETLMNCERFLLRPALGRV